MHLICHIKIILNINKDKPKKETYCLKYSASVSFFLFLKFIIIIIIIIILAKSNNDSNYNNYRIKSGNCGNFLGNNNK